MKKVSVVAEKTYDVLIDANWKDSLVTAISHRSRAAFIVSKKMRDRISDMPSMECEVHYFEIPDGEEGKSIKTLMSVWDWLGAAGFTRSDVIVGIGGGSTTDFAGYAAASWLRGIDWIAIPTTVAGMVDAAIGGKTGVNSEYGKNLIGAFHSPSQVIIDLQWLETLTDRDFAAGLAEVVKTGFISDVTILDLLDGINIESIRKNRALICELITRSVEVKAKVVSQDFKESFAREALNYGHTLGHAIELDSKYTLRHGECVSIGMVFMATLQKKMGTIPEDIYRRHLSILTNLGLPITYSSDAWPNLLTSMSLDKKSRGSSIRFVTLDGLGKTSRLESPDESVLAQTYAEVSS